MNKEFLNFSVGPVLMEEKILEMGSEQIPYFRTQEFSNIMLDNENLIKKFVNSEEDARSIFLTASGTGAMEATIINGLNINDKVLIINGGSFGARFVEICDIHCIPYEEIKLNFGEMLTKEHLKRYSNKNITALLVNMHETSTGTLYDMDIIADFCKHEKCMLIVDAISSFLADEIDMKKLGIDMLITSSQKALALPPGISIIILNKKAIHKIDKNDIKSMYFNFKSYLINGERGQTPFTPAVSILIQLNKRLNIINKYGIEKVIGKTKDLADDFRNRIVKLPFVIYNKFPSNAVTVVKPTGKMKAYDIFEYLKNNYNIFVCPNGGELKNKIFRVGHIGDLSIKDNKVLIDALNDMNKKGMF